MMETNDTIGKNLMSKLKESFHLKSFSSKSFHSSLVCDSKIIRIDAKLIGKDDTSDTSFSASNFNFKSSGNVLEKNREASNWHLKNLGNMEDKIKSADTSGIEKKSSKSENLKEFSKIGDSFTSSSKEKKLNLKTSFRHSYQTKSHDSPKRSERKSKQNSSEYVSFRCGICLKDFPSKRGVQRHSVLHRSERHPCETCGKVFQTRDNLKKHCKCMHEVQMKSLECSKCYKAFSRRDQLKIHLKKHPDHVLSTAKTSSLTDEFQLD